MILVRYGLLALIMVLGFCGTLGSAVWAYTLALSEGLKGDAERVLFYGFLIGTSELAASALLFVNAKRKSREFENMTDLVRHGGSISDERLGSFGSFGMQVKSMIRELSDSSERKSIRIASLTGLVRAVVELTDRSILIISLDGRIVAASEAIVALPAFEDMRIGVSSINKFLPEVEIQSVLEEADRSHGIVERQEHMSFIPVYSINGEITHFLVELGKKGALEAIAGMLQAKRLSNDKKLAVALPPRSGSEMGRRFRSFFSGARRKPGPPD
ncbi:MAG: hypothetical protein AB7T74_11020 [Clostridia bacterium]|nr:hypothetical protein [Spirochaetia bacterium]